MINYVFIDESGDLGRYGTDYFVVACVVVSEPKHLGRIMKKLRQKKLKKPLKKLSEIKANNSNRKIREFVLKKIAESDCEIYAIVVDKARVMPKLYEVKDRLYNFLCRILLDEIKPAGKMIITIDKKHTNTLIRENFNNYVRNDLKNRNKAKDIEINHLPSESSQTLQVVDFVAWAIARKYNHGDPFYHNLIEHKIRNKDRMLLWGDRN